MVPVVGARREAGDAVGVAAPHGEGEVDLVGGQDDVGVQREDGVGDDLGQDFVFKVENTKIIDQYES